MQSAQPLPLPRPGLLTKAFAVFLALHGFAHIVGTQASFTAADEGNTLEYLAGTWAISDPAALRGLGLAWAIVGVLYLVAAWAFWVDSPRRVGLLVLATVPSLILSVTALWMAVVGVVIDVALLSVAWWLHVAGGRRTT